MHIDACVIGKVAEPETFTRGGDLFFDVSGNPSIIMAGGGYSGIGGGGGSGIGGGGGSGIGGGSGYFSIGGTGNVHSDIQYGSSLVFSIMGLPSYSSNY